MRASGSLAGAAGAGLLLLLASAGWMAPAARAQSIVSQVTMSASGDAGAPYGAGCTFDILWMRVCLLASSSHVPPGLIFLLYVDALGYAYFCAGEYGNVPVVWKVNTGGPSSTAPSEINKVDLTVGCSDGVVRSLTGEKRFGYDDNTCIDSLTGRLVTRLRPLLRWTRMAMATGLSSTIRP